MNSRSCYDLDCPFLDWTFADSVERRKQLESLDSSVWMSRGIYGYVLHRYEDCSAILRDERWHNASTLATEMTGGTTGRPSSLTSAEGQTHARLKRLVTPAFSPRAADKIRPFMREILEEQISQIASKGQAELMGGIFNLFPVQVIAELIGAPRSDWEPFNKWAEDILVIYKENALEQIGILFKAAVELQEYVRSLIAERRLNPGGDIISSLIAAGDEHDQLDDDEMVMLLQSIIVGGTDTTRNQIGLAVATLLENRDQWQLVVENPDLAESAAEEAIRYLPITSTLARFASEDIVYRDVLFPRGTLISLALAQANKDPKVFPDPHAFDIRRVQTRPNMTFGGGIHYCLAASLARAEIQEVIRMLAIKLPDLRIDGHVTWKDPLQGVFGPEKLPVSFTA